jgi:hypothetical protein
MRACPEIRDEAAMIRQAIGTRKPEASRRRLQLCSWL